MPHVFSHRLAWDRPENALARAERARRARGEGVLDLTASNPTRVGLPDLGPRVREALAASAGGAYEPDPAGLPSARAAIARELGAAGAPIAPERLLLTASSSESYAHLFKVLCDPGDAVLVPEPSYPLFEYLARLEGVEPVPYRLAWDGVWHVDLASLDEAIARASGRARALVVGNPNNPTGSFLKRAELPALAARCEAHGLAAIADEVFAPYAVGDDPTRVRALAAESAFTARVPTFALGGLSKSCGLPQLKLGWIAVAGPPSTAGAAIERLSLVADTYLSVGAPVQAAAARLLELGRDARAAIAARLDANRAALAAALSPSSPCTALASEGGWSAIVRVPATRPDEAWAEALLVDDGVLVHPGYFFELAGGAFLVLSLLPPPDVFAEGVRRLVARCAA
ncbi:MAG TPA: pyridoxal phosphate-dependent aminotransferase [Polyangia bacterium]|nr:pyridoxal phosphate-dependent aminotransferase [Polyangia bacterium]